MNSIILKIINAYLIKIKQCVGNGNYEIVNRKKNRKFFLENNLKKDDIVKIIMSLSSDDFFDKIEEDRNEQYKGFILKFRPIWESKRLYIKVRIENDNTIFISFHEYNDI